MEFVITSLNTEIENIKSLFAQCPEMFCILSGPEHLFEYVNQAHITALGFDVTGMKVREAQPESVEIHTILDNVYTTGITAALHEIPVTVGKSLRYFDLTYAAKRDTHGVINGIMILGAEVTNRVLVDQKIALERKRMFNFFEQIPAAIAVFSGRDLVFEVANNSYKKLLGDNRNLIGHTLREAIPDLSEEIFKLLTNVLDTGERFLAHEYPLYLDWSNTGKTELKYINFFYEPLKNEKGVTDGVLVFVYDITEQIVARTKVNNALKTRDEFLSIASHELKTPLTGFNLQLQSAQRRLEKRNSEDFTLDKLDIIFGKYKKQTDRLIRLVDDMLDLSKINLGKMTFEFERQDINSIIELALDNFKDQFADKHTSLTLIGNTELIYGKFDKERMEQVFTNILSNALKYGEEKPVTIELIKKDQVVRILITDQGLGIPHENTEMIFEKFERVQSTLDISGLGIGLFITKEIVEAHEGRIWVESQFGNGSVFIVEIPVE